MDLHMTAWRHIRSDPSFPLLVSIFILGMIAGLLLSIVFYHYTS